MSRCTDRRTWLRRTCATASVALVLLCGLSATTAEASRAAAGPGVLLPLCGITELLDALLGCRPAGPQSEPPPAPAAAPSAPADQQQQQPQQPPSVSPTPRYVDDLLLVRFRRDTTQQERQRAMDNAGVTVARTIGRLGVTVVHVAAEGRDSALVQLRQSPAIARVERDAVLEQLDTTPNDTDWPAQWGLRQIGLPAAWDRTRGSSSVVVAVLDTGVDGDAPDLQDAVVPGYNAVSPQTPATDDNGHGTSVAGIVAARTDNSQGIAGICWTCSVLSVKVLGADGIGDTAQVAAGITRAVDAGARVISMSLGGPADDQTLDDAVAYALGKGVIVVAAAGNNATSLPFYPAAIPGVVSVAGTDQGDHLYPWSNFGSWVQVAAPGCNTAPSSTNGYVLFCGTSSSAPVVAGVLALELSQQPTASPDTVVDALERTAVPLGGAVHFGRIDAAAALAVLATSSSSAEPQVTTPTAREQRTGNSTITLRGVLRNGTARFRRTLPHGSVTATLRFRPRLTLALSINGAGGARVARAKGRSGLRLRRDVAAGMYTFTVTGPRTPTAFTLQLDERASA